MHNINIIFFGSSAYSLPLIESLDAHFDLTLIITRPDRPVGRSRKKTPSEPKQYAINNSIDVRTPESLNEHTEELISSIRSKNPVIAVVADYGKIIPEELFTIPEFQTMNVHFSKLPQFRGASPVQYSILSGMTSAYVSFMMLEKHLDTGPIVYQEEYPLSPNATTRSLYTELFENAARRLPDVITGLIKHRYTPAPQPEPSTGLVSTRHITKQDAYIPWELLQYAITGDDLKPSKRPEFFQQFDGAWPETIERAIRAFTPWPHAWTEVDIHGEKKRLQLLTSHISKNPQLTTHNSQLILDTVKLEGKTAASFSQFRTAYVSTHNSQPITHT